MPIKITGVFTPSAGAGAFNLVDADDIEVTSAQQGGVAAKRTLLLPASYFMPTTTAGATDTGKVEISAQHDYYFMDFPDGAAKVYAVSSCPLVMPANYDGLTLTALVEWAVNSASANSVVWGVQLLGMADSTLLSTAFGTAVEVTDAGSGTAYHNLLSAETGAITPSNSPAASRGMHVLIYRDPANASDTLAATARLLSVRLRFGLSGFGA